MFYIISIFTAEMIEKFIFETFYLRSSKKAYIYLYIINMLMNISKYHILHLLLSTTQIA